MNSIQEANNMFGEDVVAEVITIMEDLGDPDSLFIAYEDMGKYTHMECVEFLYF